MYSQKTDKRGRVMYFKDNKLVSKQDIPEGEIIKDRDYDMDVETVAPAPEAGTVESETPDVRECVVCGEPSTRIRFVNLGMVRLCEEHYLHMTVGEIAEVMRRRNEE